MVFIKYKNKTTHLLTITNMTRKILAIVVLMTTLFATSSFATGTEQPQTLGWRQWTPSTLPPPPGPGGPITSNCRIIQVGVNNNVTYEPFGKINLKNFNVSLGYFKRLSNHFGLYGGLEYMQQSFTVSNVTPPVDYSYQHLQTPFLVHFVPSKYVYVGAGAEYAYLLGASLNGKAVNLSNNFDFKRSGVGLISDISFGWAERSPRLGVRYTYRTGAARANQNNSTVDLTLRVPF
jgi:RIP homotypic interaction motif